jgi:hypothetical protein
MRRRRPRMSFPSWRRSIAASLGPSSLQMKIQGPRTGQWRCAGVVCFFKDTDLEFTAGCFPLVLWRRFLRRALLGKACTLFCTSVFLAQGLLTEPISLCREWRVMILVVLLAWCSWSRWCAVCVGVPVLLGELRPDTLVRPACALPLRRCSPLVFSPVISSVALFSCVSVQYFVINWF